MRVGEAKSIVRLAVPVMLARAGAIILITVDTTMCGFAGSEQLAYYGIANALHLAPLFFGIGFLVGIVVYTATCDGAGNFDVCGKTWKVGLIHAFIIGSLVALVLQFGEELLRVTGQTEQLAHGGGKVLVMHSLGIIPMLGIIATSMFLEGLQKPVPGMIAMLCANLLNLFLNWLLIFGNLAAPEMGAEGAALATAIVRWSTFSGLVIYVLLNVDSEKYGIRSKLTGGFEISRILRRMGYPTGVAHGFEAISFAIMTMYAGFMGVLQTAVWTIGMNLITIAFMFALGFSTAASVRVANNMGRSDLNAAAWSGWTATALVLIVLGALGIGYYSAPEFFIGIYNREPEVLLLAAPMVAITAIVIIPDGLQVVLVGALRGMQDMWFIALSLVIGFFLVMLPIGYFMGVMSDGTPLDLMIAVTIGATVATIILAIRFRYLTRA